MILQELFNLYNRLVVDPQRNACIPTQGFSTQNISFAITLTRDGQLVDFEDIRQSVTKGKKTVLISQKRMVLGGGKPSGSGLNPSFLWDNPGYLLGYKGSDDEKKEKRAHESFIVLRDKHLSVEKSINHPHYSAVCRFLENWDTKQASNFFTNKELLIGNGIFKIQGEENYVHEYPELRKWWLDGGQELWKNADSAPNDNAQQDMCLITGNVSKLAILHEPIIKGVAHAQTMGAKLVSFNCDSFTSYGKDQSINAPVSEKAAFAYCNALNYLLSRRENHLPFGDATTVFWADSPPSEMEELSSIFTFNINPPKDLDTQPDAIDTATFQRVKQVLSLMATGKFTKDKLEDAHARFFILGISPNSSRLSIRFWHESTFGSLMESIQKHYLDMYLERQWTEKNSKYPDPLLISPNAILKETSRETKDVPPLFSGALMLSILNNTPYPDAIAQAILRRSKLDTNINYIRCSFLKAWLLRRTSLTTQYIITPMINYDNKQQGYLIGRLFAAYEKTQLDANPDRKLNKTIRDNYYSSASATPRGVMARLQRLYSHHLSKLDGGIKTNREKLIQSIVNELQDFPAHMNLEQQAQFTLGYYQQMQAFYAIKNEQ